MQSNSHIDPVLATIHIVQLDLSRAHTPNPLRHLEMLCAVDNLIPTCTHCLWMYSTIVHVQKAHGLKSIGMANKITVFVTFVGLAKQFEAQ